MKTHRSLILPALLLALATTGSPAAASPLVVPSFDQVPLACEVQGQGPIAVVLIHGWSCDRSTWDAQIAPLAGAYRVVALDLAGHGASGQGRAQWTIPAFARDVQAVVEALKLERVVLVGHSMGGYVAVAAAGLMPGRVVGVIGVDTMQNAGRVVRPEDLKAFVDAMKADFPAFTREFVAGMFAAGADTALVARAARGMSARPPAVAVPVFEGLFAYDLPAGWAAVRCPIREINSDKYPTDVAGNRALHADFDFDVIPGAGHFLHWEKPAEFNAALLKRLAEVAK